MVKMNNKREVIETSIALHPYQVALIKGLQSGNIDFNKDSLREIARKCGDKKESPQQIKHHIGYLVRLGVIQIIRGQYVYYKTK
jgi:hypothetical protein